MRKLNSLFGILMTLIILACSSDDDNGTGEQPPTENNKLLRKITFNGSENYSLTFFYNENNTLDRIESSGTNDDFIKQFFYTNGVIDRAEFQDLNGVSNGSIERYIYNNGQLIGREDFFNSITLDEKFEYSFSSNLIDNIKYFGFNETSFSIQDTFVYDSNNNVVSRKTDYTNNSISDEEITFSFDTNNSPFLNVEPKIVLIDDFSSFVNNPTSETITDLSTNNIISQNNYSYTYDSDNYAISQTNGTEMTTYEYYE